MTTSAKNYLIEVSPELHTSVLRQRERASNAGSTAWYNLPKDRTEWSVAGELVAVSEGQIGSRKRYWAVVALKPSQHALAIDQLSNNEVSSDDEMIAHFFNEGRIPSVDAKVMLEVERPRCLVNTFYEPLQERYVP